jgi:hypothetical protein
MNYKKNFDPNLLKKGSKLRRQLDENTYEYLSVGNYYPQFGWELKPYGKSLYKSQGILLYIKPSDLPGEFELLMED